MVETYLASPSELAWEKFTTQYLALLEERLNRDPIPFDQLAELAAEHEVFLGCSCPTMKNPRVDHCHTWLALQFMSEVLQKSSYEAEIPSTGRSV